MISNACIDRSSYIFRADDPVNDFWNQQLAPMIPNIIGMGAAMYAAQYIAKKYGRKLAK